MNLLNILINKAFTIKVWGLTDRLGARVITD